MNILEQSARYGLKLVPRSRRQQLKSNFIWLWLLRRAAQKGIPASSLDRVHSYLRSHYDKAAVSTCPPPAKTTGELLSRPTRAPHS